MVGSSYAHKPKLRTYIRSRGTRAPIGFSRHLPGHDLADQCIFCSSPHDSYELMLYPEGGIKGAEAVNVFMCSMCFSVVKEMESKLAGYNGMGTHYDSLGTQNRIDLFVSYCDFEQTRVALYFQHNTEMYINLPEREMCYFCNNIVHEGYILFDVPLSGGDYVDGGKVRCCLPCRDTIRELLPEQHIGDFMKNKGLVAVTCPTCGSRYIINGPEHHYRTTSYGLASYQCPTCMIKSMVTVKDDNTIISDLLHMTLHEARIQRFELEDCSFCESPLDIDKMLLPNVLSREHVSKKGSRLMCRSCADGFGGPIAAVTYQHKLWLLYESNAPNVYIRRIKNGRGKVIDTKSMTGEVAKMILWAVDDIKSVTKEGRQERLIF